MMPSHFRLCTDEGPEGRTLFAVGEGKFWVCDPFAVHYPNYGIGVVVRFSLLETV